MEFAAEFRGANEVIKFPRSSKISALLFRAGLVILKMLDN